jgi:hypothetical protein
MNRMNRIESIESIILLFVTDEDVLVLWFIFCYHDVLCSQDRRQDRHKLLLKIED